MVSPDRLSFDSFSKKINDFNKIPMQTVHHLQTIQTYNLFHNITKPKLYYKNHDIHDTTFRYSYNYYIDYDAMNDYI